MLPVVAGRAATARQILDLQRSPGPDLGAAVGTGVCRRDLWRDRRCLRSDLHCARVAAGQEPASDRRAAHRLFVFSISYLFVLFAALLADHNRATTSACARLIPPAEPDDRAVALCQSIRCRSPSTRWRSAAAPRACSIRKDPLPPPSGKSCSTRSASCWRS